jgi:molecular chaperone DnaJ
MSLPGTEGIFPDYYAELGVPTDASPDAVRASYRSLARLIHSGARGSSTDVLRRALLDRAYTVLHDSRKRAAYDILRRARFGSFILLLVRPTAHPLGRIFLSLLALLAVLLLIAVVTFHWDLAVSVLGLGSVVLILSKALLDWLVPSPDTGRSHAGEDDG